MKKYLPYLFAVGGFVLNIALAQGEFGTATDQQQLQQLQQIQAPTSPAPAAPANASFPPLPPQIATDNAIPELPLPNAMPGPLQPPPPPPPVAPAYVGPTNVPQPMTMPQKAISDAAFNDAAQTTFPMTTEQIHHFHQLYNASQEAAAAPPGTPPRPTATSQIVSLAPGSTPPVVRLAQGFITSLVFLDSTGAPWPIDAYDIGNPGAFNIQWNHTDNTLMIQASTLYTYGNLAVRLRNLSTPVMITLIPGQQAVDYRIDMRIQGLGPNAKPPVGSNLPSGANPVLLGVLDGVPPMGSKTLTVSGGEAQAWLLVDKLYVRTTLTLLSPAWMATMSSADGMNAYELQKTPMLLVSYHGKPIQLRVEGL